MTPRDAAGILQNLKQQEVHSFWPLKVSVTELPDDILARIQGYRQVTDAMLLATAIQHHGQLATLDIGLTRLAAENRRDSVCVIPV